MTFFMYVGYLVKDLKKFYDKASKEIKASLFVVVILIWGDFILDFKSFWLVHCDIGRGPVDVFASLAACFSLIVICGWIEKGPLFISKSLGFLGKYSIFVLVAHLIELNTFPWTMLIHKIAGADVGKSTSFYYSIRRKNDMGRVGNIYMFKD